MIESNPFFESSSGLSDRSPIGVFIEGRFDCRETPSEPEVHSFYNWNFWIPLSESGNDMFRDYFLMRC